MSTASSHPASFSSSIDEIRSLARPLTTSADFDPLIEVIGDARFVAIGEASHGTHEFYRWRAALSRRLITERGFTWIGVEGDWPDCWRINRWVRGQSDQELDAAGVLSRFERWPTWMWANREVTEFLDWLHEWNSHRLMRDRVGFYGLDVYSLWDSLYGILTWLGENAPDAVPAAMRAWECFVPFEEDPHRYAWSTRLVPENCENDVVGLLLEVRRRARPSELRDDAVFDAIQNAEVAAAAEQYYRIMMRGDRESWNIRDIHMTDTIDRLSAHLGSRSRGLIWAHNTHVGDARATGMARSGLVNVGQLLRERHGVDGVALIGFAAHRGEVIAAEAWGSPDQVMPVPDAAPSTHEGQLHAALGKQALLVFGPDRSGPWLSARLGHRAIGVVYEPTSEYGNFVPTVMGVRYDALCWFEDSRALQPLHREPHSEEPEFETEPTGF